MPDSATSAERPNLGPVVGLDLGGLHARSEPFAARSANALYRESMASAIRTTWSGLEHLHYCVALD
jgi:hypothetical protein